LAGRRLGKENLWYGRSSDREALRMPYKQITQLPDNVKNNLAQARPGDLQGGLQLRGSQYGEEGRAHATAWSAVENKYEKNDEGNWVQK
jgi:cation transport regulator